MTGSAVSLTCDFNYTPSAVNLLVCKINGHQRAEGPADLPQFRLRTQAGVSVANTIIQQLCLQLTKGEKNNLIDLRTITIHRFQYFLVTMAPY